MAPLPDEWKEEFARLRAERDLAWQHMSKLQSSIDELTQMIARQNDQLEQVTRMLRRRDEQYQRVAAENRKLRRQLGLEDPEPDPPSGGAAPGAPDGGDDGASAASDEGTGAGQGAESDAGDGDATPRKSSSRPRSRGGRRPPPSHLPTDTELHSVCACEACGGRVFKRDVQETAVYTVVPTYVRRRLIRRERVLCADPACGHATTAPMPPMPCDRALYDCKFLAWLVVMKFVLLVPLDRIRTLLASQGVHIAIGSLVHLIERAADLAGPIDGEHLKQLRRGSYLCFDGTGLKTLVLGQDKAWDGYLEVFTRDELTVFQFDMTKHADELRGRLNGFLGILVCDAETRNRAGAPDLELANCNAHPRRKFRDAERVQPHLAVEGAAFIQRLYELEDQADLMGLTGAERVAFRRRRCRPVLDDFRAWLQEVVDGPLPPSDPVRKIATYYLKHFADLTRFVDHAELPLDNNAAEREFQRHAKLRQASLFAGSPEGGHRWATLLGVVRTAQKCDIDVQAYLTWMFERRGSHRKQFGMSAAELTPMAYRDLGCPGALAAA